MDVIFDIDGTLASADHRLHLIMSHGAKDWEKFLSPEMIDQDKPILQIWLLLYLLVKEGHNIIFITGRSEKTRVVTSSWLLRSAYELYDAAFIVDIRMCPIYMRANDDHRDSHVVKEASLKQAIKDGYNPELCFEDRISDAEMWRRNGIRTCQVAEGNF